MAIDICVGCTKFSHAVGVRPENNSIPWTHLSAPDLCLLIRGQDTSVRDGELVLRIVQGNKSLDTVDVGMLTDRAAVARQRTQQAGIMPQIEQLPIFGINKDALLALRYRLEDQQDRRLQFRLNSASDCNLIVNIFKQRGMEFQQQRPRTGRPGTGRPDTASSETRPTTMQSSSSYFPVAPGPPRKSPFQTQTIEAGDLSRPQSTAARPHTSDPTAPEDMAPPPFFNRAVALSSQASTFPPTSTFQLHRSFTTPYQESEDRLPAVNYRTSEPFNEVSQPALQQPPIVGAPKILDEHMRGPAPHLDVFPASSISQQSGLLHASAIERELDTNRSAIFHSIPAVKPYLVETLEHEIPPRREMPFERPGSQQTNSSRPGTAAQVIQKSKTGQAHSSSPAGPKSAVSRKRTPTPRPSTASPLKRTFNAYEEPAEPARPMTSNMRQQDVQWNKRPSPDRPAVVATRQISPISESRRPSDVGELIRSHKPLSEKSPNAHRVRRLDSRADAPYEFDTPPRTSSPKDKENQRVALAASPTGQRLSRADPTINAVAAVQRGRFGEASLQEYVSQSLQDRQAILDEFMISKLEDPDFTILCEDVDSCWRRIALGL